MSEISLLTMEKVSTYPQPYVTIYASNNFLHFVSDKENFFKTISCVLVLQVLNREFSKLWRRSLVR